MLYPTTYEGFGLIPFEAAARDRPCLFASQAALAETLPAELASLVPWDPRASAERVHRLLSSPEASAAHVRSVRRAGERFTWNAAGHALVDAYIAAAASPARDAARMARDLAGVELERDESERKYAELWGAFTNDAVTLVDPGGPLGPEAQRSLAAAARRPVLRRLLLAPAELAYRLGGRQRRERPEEPATTPDKFALHFATSNREHMRGYGEQREPDDHLDEQ